ncbi:MAG: hypothetical protein N3F66_11050 [Spirochaetes bacterium]|nr:hypothetical protein [Spirochaetota bacterium]
MSDDKAEAFVGLLVGLHIYLIVSDIIGKTLFLIIANIATWGSLLYFRFNRLHRLHFYKKQIYWGTSIDQEYEINLQRIQKLYHQQIASADMDDTQPKKRKSCLQCALY